MGPLTASAWIFLLTTLVLLPFLFREQTRNSRLGRGPKLRRTFAAGGAESGEIYIHWSGWVGVGLGVPCVGREMANGFEPFPHLPYGTHHHQHGFHHSQGEDDVGKMAELADFNIRRADPLEY